MEAQNKQLLKRLRKGTITQGQALKELAIARLASRINDLRNEGHNIITQMIATKNRNGDPVRIGRYTLVKEKKGQRVAH